MACPQLSLPVCGIMLMVCSGILLNILLGICQHLAATGWPDLLMMACNNAIAALLAGAWLAHSRPPLPERRELKWIVLAGLAFTASFTCMLLAVRLGISLGDFASLNSTNVVFAALLGRVFLNEPLQAPHIAAVVGSVLGATLIAQPEALFGTGGTSAPWAAYVFALLSGLGDAGIYICSRRLSEMSPAYLVLSFNAPCAVASLFCAAMVDGGLEGGLSVMAAVPMEAAWWILGTAALYLASLAVFTLASQWCPAAVSATTDTATRMIVGYAAQLLLGTAPLDALTLAGAGLMLGGVVVMAAARRSPEGETQEPVEAEAVPADDASETSSLASFIASEFADAAPQGWNADRLRQRRTNDEESKTPLPQVVGATATALSVVMSTASV